MELDNIWGDSAEQISANRGASDVPLFLPDNDDDIVMSRRGVGSPPPPPDIDLDEMFADVDKDGDDDDFSFKPAGSGLNIEALKRRAEARAKERASSPLTGTDHEELRSSSLPPAEEKSKNEKGKKERRKPIKLDEGRLLNPEIGFRQLVKDTKHFKIKGKGHEVRL